jgi:hypothetical protein
MSALLADEPPSNADRALKPPGFWLRLAQAVDQLFVNRTRRAVPEHTLRRSRQEVQRCRRLMLKGAPSPITANKMRASPQPSHSKNFQ